MAPNLNSDDYYQILGVPRNADEAALKKAYKKLAVKVRFNRCRRRILSTPPNQMFVERGRKKRLNLTTSYTPNLIR